MLRAGSGGGSNHGGDAAVRQRPGRTALVVEDEPSLRAMTRPMLERNGYTVVDAADGTAAWR